MSDDVQSSTATAAAGTASHGTGETRVQPGPPVGEPIFTRAEIAGFAEDDATAGRAIGRMLAIFFVYTVIAMSIAAYWTFTSIAG